MRRRLPQKTKRRSMARSKGRSRSISLGVPKDKRSVGVLILDVPHLDDLASATIVEANSVVSLLFGEARSALDGDSLVELAGLQVNGVLNDFSLSLRSGPSIDVQQPNQNDRILSVELRIRSIPISAKRFVLSVD